MRVLHGKSMTLSGSIELPTKGHPLVNKRYIQHLLNWREAFHFDRKANIERTLYQPKKGGQHLAAGLYNKK
jgi:hypothetical protein